MKYTCNYGIWGLYVGMLNKLLFEHKGTLAVMFSVAAHIKQKAARFYSNTS
jgi:hypothetical protein